MILLQRKSVFKYGPFTLTDFTGKCHREMSIISTTVESLFYDILFATANDSVLGWKGNIQVITDLVLNVRV